MTQVPDQPLSSAAPPGRLGPFARPVGLAATLVTVFQLYYILSPHLSPSEGDAAYLLLNGGLLALYLATTLRLARGGSTRRRIDSRHGPAVVVPAIVGLTLGVAAFLFSLDPAVFRGFVELPPVSASAFAFLVTSSLLAAAGQESVNRGLLLPGLLRRISPARAVVLSGALFALQMTDLPLLPALRGDALAQYLALTTAISVLVGVLAAWLYLLEGRNLVAPVAFRSVLITLPMVVPWVAPTPGWEYAFLFELLGLAVVGLGIVVRAESLRRFQRRFLGDRAPSARGRVTQRVRRRREAVATGVALVPVAALILLLAAPSLSVSAPVHLYAIASGSMVPTFHRGDLVLVEPPSGPAAVRIGSIVAYHAPWNPAGPVVHRVIAIHYGPGGTLLYTIKGDANPSPDPGPVSYSSIIGLVVFIVPWAGYPILYPALSFAVAVGVVGALVVWSSRSARPRVELPIPEPRPE